MVTLPPVREKRRVDSVANLLRRAILEGQVKPGERFPSEREMASQLRVGRIVVREALRTLESAGLVSIKRGVTGGCFVREFGADQVSKSFSDALQFAPISLKNLLEVRLALEGAIIRAVMERATQSDLKRVEKNLSEMRAMLNGKGESPGLKDKVHEFHTLLADLTQNPLLGLLMRAVVNVINQYMEALGYRSIVSRHTITDHEQIFRCLTSRDSEKALAAMQKHIADDNRRLVRRAAREKVQKIHYASLL